MFLRRDLGMVYYPQSSTDLYFAFCIHLVSHKICLSWHLFSPVCSLLLSCMLCVHLMKLTSLLPEMVSMLKLGLQTPPPYVLLFQLQRFLHPFLSSFTSFCVHSPSPPPQCPSLLCIITSTMYCNFCVCLVLHKSIVISMSFGIT